MNILPFHQGTPGWLAARAKHFCASEAPAMMGASKYITRNDLLRLKATGIAEEVDADTQKLFDAGHAAEAAMRPIIEGHLRKQHGQPVPLLPLTGTDGNLLASFDGLNEDKATGWEHKLWSEGLAMQVRAKSLDPHYYWQLEQQILVGKLNLVIFTCSDGTAEKCVHMAYRPVPGRAEQLLAGWKQFEADLASYQHVEVIPAATAVPIMALPALSIQVNGAITLTDNLKVFGEKLEAFIAGLDKNPSTDQAFADAEQAIKTLETAQNALEAAEASALAQVATVDEMRRTVALYAGQARSTRLMLTKLVAARKETIRVEIVQDGRTTLAKHVAGLNKRLGKSYMPAIAEDFAGVIRGKKTVASLREAVDTELARCKIAANEIADRVHLNLIALTNAGAYQFLFADAATIVLKEPDDLTALIKVRIAEHKAAEEKRLEAEREKIRQEEAAKLQEQQAKETAAVQVPAQPQSGAPSPAQHPEPAPAASPITQPDADVILLDFKERFGRRKEFAGVTRAILDYFKSKEKPRSQARNAPVATSRAA